MKKISIVIIAIIIIILISFGVFWFMQRSGFNSGNEGTAGNLPPVSTSTPALATPTTTTVVIGTAQGGVTVNNFYKNAEYITQDQQTVAMKDTSDYGIAYNVGDSSFVIVLLSNPLETARQAAEAAFLSSLGISKQDACKLTVYEGIPAAVSDQYVGENFPLSFCGGSSTL